MSSDADEGSDSDGTSANTILKELCLLRCSSCGSNTREKSQVTSQLSSVNFSSFCASEVTETHGPSSIVEGPSFSDPPKSLIYQDYSSSARALSSNSSRQFREKNIFFNELSDSRLFSNPWFKRLQNIVSGSNGSIESFFPVRSRQIKRTSFSRASQVESTYNLNSTGTDTPNFDSNWIKRAVGLKLSDRSQQTSLRSESEDSVECLLRERCSSSDCACDKLRFRNVRKISKKSRRKPEHRGRPRSVASQVNETIHGLKLTGWDGQIIIKEEDFDFILDKVKNERADSRESVPSVFDLCRISSLSNQSSDSALTFLKKCSDSNLLTSLGLKEDQSLLRKETAVSSKDNSDNKNSKGQVVETYGKLLHKIEKLKKMTSWKSKKRKNKLKYTLEGAEFSEEHLDNNIDTNIKGKRSDRDIEISNADGDHMSCGDAVTVFTQCCDESKESELREIESEDNPQIIKAVLKRMTCDVGIQSVHPVMSESFLTTIESSIDEVNIRVQDKKMSNINNDIQEEALRMSKNMADLKKNCMPGNTENNKTSRKRPDSAASIGTCSLLQSIDKSLSGSGDRETQDEILEHLRQINNLIERESCVSNSTHRLCKSERSLGFEANKVARPKRLINVDKDKKDITKSRKEGRIYWAVTKVTVYPDSCRTYEVMRLSRRRPQNVPSSSETVFVLLPNK